VAAGPVGRTASVAVTPVAAIYSYSRSKGLFAGVSVTGTVIVTRNGANEQYYGGDAGGDPLESGETAGRRRQAPHGAGEVLILPAS
jgi:SH3 domain-containing YSC84-like protein 1